MGVNMNMIMVGPAGGNKGTTWKEKGKSEITKIFVSHNENGIYSLQFLFVNINSNFVLSDRHGVARNKNFTTVLLDHPTKFLTWIGGSHIIESHYASPLLTSITFGTNKGTCGPYGKMDLTDNEFNFDIGGDSSFGGFHGTKYRNCIESIDVYMKTSKSSMVRPTGSRVRVTPRVTVKREED